ncbi:MAG: hypothetical protein FJX75_26350 [Armatimonadetes bacterium]|nr:hypothetical protein [Armatimonadota bacterium]
MALFIGVEGVGMRQTVGVACDESGSIRWAERFPWGMSLHTTPRDELRSRLLELFGAVAAGTGGSPGVLADATVCIGLTGVTFPYDAQVDLRREFDEIELDVRELICTGDAEIIFASHTQSDTGAAIICHMGSTAYVVVRGEHHRFGGWGPALGDEGSGYWIGRSALRAIGAEYDSRRQPSVLWEEIKEWLLAPDETVDEWGTAAIRWADTLEQVAQAKCDPRTAVFAFAHDVARESTWFARVVISGLTLPVFSAWRRRDAVADRIVQEAAAELCGQLASACEVASVGGDFGRLVLYGGLFAHHPDFRELVVRLVTNQAGREVEVVLPSDPGTMRPACGALLFALGGAGRGEPRLPDQPVIDRLLRNEVPTGVKDVLSND